MHLMLAMWMATPAALADDCDAAALETSLNEASPTQVAKAYTALASCDEAAGRKATDGAFGRMLASEEAYAAAGTAIGLGEGARVHTWLDTLEPDHRSAAIAWLGDACKDSESVADFFIAARADLGEQFFVERWHRGLGECRTEGIQTLLTDELAASVEGGKVKDTTGFFALLEIYARNLAMDSVPTLAGLARDLTDEEVQSYVVNAFADAAQVGSATGANPVVADAAVKEIVALGPDLGTRGVVQARTTLLSLGADREADGFAVHRWAERFSGGYSYAATATEILTCKNGKQQGYFHHAPFTEGGGMWPEQLDPLLREKLVHEWDLHAAERCKGTGEVSVNMPSEPFADDAARSAWLEEQLKAFEAATAGYSKSSVVKHDSFEM
jgi:hypothetical protein